MKFYGINSRGKFWVHRVDNINDVTHRGSVDEGRLLYNRANQHLYTGNEVDWVKVTTKYDIFEVDTKILFNSFPLPDSWTLDTTYNDTWVMTTELSASVFTGGGSWTISGMQSTGSHNHGARTGGPTANSNLIGRSDIYTTGSNTSHSHTISTDGDHQHFMDGSWRPAYIVSIVATYS